MPEKKTVFERISHGYYQFTDAERKVADYVVVHQRDAQLMSISELAEDCGVAEATVSRFCRRLNYAGYGAFKLAIANATAVQAAEQLPTGAIQPEDSILTVAQKLYAAHTDALSQTLGMVREEAVEKAADLLANARRVLCMGQGGSMILANEAAHLFSTSLPNFQAVADSHLQLIAAAHLTPEDAVLFFSYSGSTQEVVELLPVVRERGAGIILITHFPKSPAAAYADVILPCGANELPLQHGSVAARMGQLFLVDLLFTQVCRRKKEECAEIREQVAAALARKHV